MPPTVNAAQGKQLSDIKTTLQNLSSGLSSMSAPEKAKFEASSQSEGIKSVLTESGNYLGTLENKNGVITSKGARNAVNGAKDSLNQNGVNTSGDAFAKLQSAFNEATRKYETEKKARTEADANLSIADQRQQQAVEDAVTQAKGGTPIPTPTDGATPDGTGTDGKVAPTVPLAGLENDPVAIALAQAQTEKTNLINTQMEELRNMFEDEDEDTKMSIRNAEKLAKVQTARITKENERLRQAAQVAGIVSGRGMYSPYEHEGIITEVVQEGLARVQEIEYTKQETILTAKKALRDFRYKTFTEATDLVNDLTDMKRQTVIDMNARLIEIDTQQREKQRFDNEQSDRNALILAPELKDATPDEIYKAALANGIEAGALSRAVADYKYEQETRDLEKQSTLLGMESTRENIRSSQDARRRANEKVTEPEEPEPLLTPAEIKTLGETYPELAGKIPTSWRRSDLNTFTSMFPNAPKEELPRLIEKFNNPGKETNIDTVVSDVTKKVKADKAFKAAADAAGSSSIWKGKNKDISNWVSEKSRQDRIKALAAEGYEVYEIVDILKKESGV